MDEFERDNPLDYDEKTQAEYAEWLDDLTAKQIKEDLASGQFEREMEHEARWHRLNHVHDIWYKHTFGDDHEKWHRVMGERGPEGLPQPTMDTLEKWEAQYGVGESDDDQTTPPRRESDRQFRLV